VVGVRPGLPATVTDDNLESAEVAAATDLHEVDVRARAGGRGLLLLLGLGLVLTALIRHERGQGGFRPLAGFAVAAVGLAILALPPLGGGDAARNLVVTQTLPVNAQEVLPGLPDFDGVALSQTIEVAFFEALFPEVVLNRMVEFNHRTIDIPPGATIFLNHAVSSEVEPILLDLLQDGVEFESWRFWFNSDVNILHTGYFSHRILAREYAHQHVQSEDGARKDFTEVLYWNPLLVTGSNGTAAVSFETADAITSYRITAEAHSARGGLGAEEARIQNRLPCWLEPKLPAALTAGDRLLLPVVCANDTAHRETMSVELAGSPAQSIDVAAGERSRVLFDLTAKPGELQVDLTGGSSEGRADRTVRTVPVAPRGYPVSVVKSGVIESRAEFRILLPAEVDRASVEGSLRLYPSIVATICDGIEGMLRTPGGCFEQVSSTTYPNVLVLSCLSETGAASPAIARRARELLADGYERLVGYECKGGGFDWFGGDVGHEALTAYGVLEFTEMARFIDVDRKMLDRTLAWLLSRRDGQGGFRSDANRHSFGNAPAEIGDAYILFALTEAGVEADLSRELASLEGRARRSDDAYFLALTTLALGNAKRPAAVEFAGKLANLLQQDGSLTGTRTSITSSRGRNLTVETTALGAMALLRNGRTDLASSAIRYLAGARQSGGDFGATQATILAMTALAEYARLVPRPGACEVTVFLNGRAVSEQHIAAGAHGVVTVGEEVLAALVPGENRIELRSTGEEPLPFCLDLGCHTRVPASAPDCAVSVVTRLAGERAPEGSSVDLMVTITNREEAAEVPMTVVRVGLPAGLVPRTERLSEMRQAGEIAFFETRLNEVTLYLAGLPAGGKRELTLDLTAEFPGEFEGPATSAYLYYDDDRKDWAAPLSIRIDPAK
jgi:hypothetical protein